MLETLTEASEKRPVAVVLMVVAITAGMTYGASQISMTSEMDEFLPEDLASVKVTGAVENSVGRTVSEYILVQDDNVASPETFKSILQLQMEIQSESMNPETANENRYVQKITSYPGIVVKLLQKRNKNWKDMSELELERAISMILSSSEEVASLVSENRDSTIIRVTVNSDLPQENLSDKTDELKTLVRNFDDRQKDLSARITGSVSMEMETQDMMNRDNRILIPSAAILVMVILFFVFRKLSDVGFPFLVLLLGTLWMIGTMGLLGINFTMVYVALVPVILGVGIDYTIHMLNRYYEERGNGLAVEEASVKSVQTVGVAVALTAVTTIVGFGSFGVSDMPPIRNFGFLAASGVFYIFLLATTLLPALLVIRDRGNGGKGDHSYGGEGEDGRDRIGLALSKLETGVRKHGKPIMIGVILITVLSTISLTGLSTTMAMDTFLPNDADSVQTMEAMEAEFGGQTMSNYVLVRGNLTDPETLRKIKSYQGSVLSDPESTGLVVGSSSLLDSFPGGRIPEDPERISKLLENASGSPQAGRYFPNEDSTLVYFSIRAETDKEMRTSTDILRNHIEKMEGDADSSFRIDGDPAVGGAPAIISDVMEIILPNMRNSIILAVILVIVVLGIVFRSPMVGLIGSVPVLIALSWELGAMQAFGWSLDVMNMMVSALAIGIGVDFTIHVTHRFHEEWTENGKSPVESMSITIKSVGRAIAAAAATTIGTFVVLSLSRMPPVTRFGQLAALVILFALIGSLVVLPPVLLAYARWKEDRNNE